MIEDQSLKEELMEILNLEKSDYNKGLSTVLEVNKKKEIFKKKLDSRFLLDDSDDEYGKEIYDLFEREPQDILDMHNENSGIRPMRNGGSNDYM